MRGLLDQLRGAFMARGADLATATERARAALYGMVQRQAMMLSFTDIFRWLAVLFVAMLPLLLMMRSPRRASAGMGAAH